MEKQINYVTKVRQFGMKLIQDMKDFVKENNGVYLYMDTDTTIVVVGGITITTSTLISIPEKFEKKVDISKCLACQNFGHINLLKYDFKCDYEPSTCINFKQKV